MEKRSLVTIADHSREKIEYLIEMAQEFEAHPNRSLLKGRVVATLFFEPSTRTRLSFETAANRLGARVIGFVNLKFVYFLIFCQWRYSNRKYIKILKVAMV